LSLAQAYRLSDVPGDGAEVWSFDTGKQREQQS
jgi:hypothetical protein